MKEIIINKDLNNNQSIVALLENGRLIEQYDDSNNINAFEGNIYCGIVRNILPGMQSAFVDIGEDKNAFLHIKDVIPKVSNQTGNKEEDLSKYDINKYLKVNMPILVQVKKDEEDKKGARISKHISLTGRLCVLLIDENFITVSQKIEDKDERDRLKNVASKILKNIKAQNYGLILRTASEGKEQEEIEKDIKELIQLWDAIYEKYNDIIKEHKPQLIYKNYNIISKFLTSVLETDISRVIVNSKSIYSSIEKYIKEIHKENIEIDYREENLMQMYDLQEQLEKIHERKIWLKCGGFITIDKTEALTAIDVNSGKFTGKKDMQKNNTIFKVNKEATIEIAKQIRLRNISGIIVIDYIDMQRDEERKEIIELLEQNLKQDRSKTQVIGFTKLDLLEMTRKKL